MTTLEKIRIVQDHGPKTPRRVVAPPARASDTAYRAYKPQPFTREEREQVTVLFGGLHWRAERLIQGAMENLGYRTKVLPTATREDLLTGREVADIGQCCPTSFTTGNLANYLKAEAKRSSPAEVSKNFVYVTAGSMFDDGGTGIYSPGAPGIGGQGPGNSGVLGVVTDVLHE